MDIIKKNLDIYASFDSIDYNLYHFSKYCNSYLLNTKEKYEVFTHIRDFIEKNGKPNHLVTDN